MYLVSQHSTEAPLDRKHTLFNIGGSNYDSHNKKYHSGIRGIYITNTSTTMVFANEKTRFTTITVSRLLLLFP